MLRTLGGRYTLQEQIGGGGMAVVYRAVDTLLGRTVAVKMLRQQHTGDEDLVTRFRQEAQSAARLSHPNIVSLYDIGVSDGDYYIVMEYVDGPTLKEVIKERAPLPVREVVDITGQICDALEHAHAHQIIHRDIKPHNILLTAAGTVKVTDFGIARAITGDTITHESGGASVLGSVHYFSPEQARGAMTDMKSDIYSMGVVMYEMLTGELPFSGDSPVSVALKHLRERFVEPRVLSPDIPQSLENIVLRCLVKSPDARYPNMRAVKLDLKDALVNPDVPKFVMPVEVTEETIAIPTLSNASGSAGTSHAGTAATSARAKKKRPWWMGVIWGGVAVAVLCIGAFAAYYILMALVQVKDVTLPNVVGMTERQAMTSLQKVGFSAAQVTALHEANASEPKGTVYAQNPVAQTPVKPSRELTLYVSSGQPQISMPSLQGMPVDQAIAQLVNLGFSKVNIKTQKVQNSQVPIGSVVGTTPTAGTNLTANANIVIQESSGQTTIPDVLGLSLPLAEEALQSANLKYVLVFQPYGAQDQTVFMISPYTVGQKVPLETSINLYVVDNSGTSGGNVVAPGNGTGNSTSNATGSTGSQGTDTTAVAGGVQSDTEVRSIVVKVLVSGGAPTVVQIQKTDAQSPQAETVVDQTITATTRWPVTMTVTPQSNGEIMVYVNGQLAQDLPVIYGAN